MKLILQRFLFLKMLTITVNDRIVKLDKEMNILSLLTYLDIFSQGVAVAVNKKVVSKKSWSYFYVKEADKILIIKATQGG